MTTKTEQTNVQQVDLSDLGDILGNPAETIMLADEGGKEKKKSIFSSMSPDTTFLDKPDLSTQKTEEELAAEAAAKAEADKGKTEEELAAEKKKKEDEDAAASAANPDTSFLDPNADADAQAAADAEAEKNKGGRPAALISATKKLIDDGFIKPFQNEKGEEEPIDNYSSEDFHELLKANFEAKEQELTKVVPQQFMEQLPEELKAAYHYVNQGGSDLKGLFTHLAASEEMRELDVTSENGQKQAIRSYLQATGYGTPEEIEDEIFTLEDRGELEKKANQFKPKLDAMQEQIINQKLVEQEKQNNLRAQESQKYINSVFSTLETGELNGVKLDNKTQNMLYAGLVQSNYPSSTGKDTNMLGHLLEKYQWQEPRHDLIAEALWLLADPDGYKNNIASNVGQKKDEETFRTLKTEQSSKNSSTAVSDDDEQGGQRHVRKTGIQRPKKNFFGR